MGFDYDTDYNESNGETFRYIYIDNNDIFVLAKDVMEFTRPLNSKLGLFPIDYYKDADGFIFSTDEVEGYL